MGERIIQTEPSKMRADFRLGDWIIRPRRDCIERGDGIVHIHPRPMAVLECLAAAGGEVVTRDELFNAVWPGVIVTDDALTQCVVELRKAFGDSAHDAQIIRTIPKVGFCLIPPVTMLPEEHVASRKMNQASLITAATILLALMVFWYLGASRDRVPAIPFNPAPSIAVLPFADMSEGQDQKYFADGLSEELLNTLAHLEGLKVTGRTSSFQFRGKNEDLRVIAETLGVSHVLDGSVRKDAKRLRITAQLLDAVSGFQLWSETYDRELDDIFAIQDEIAAAVVDALKLTLLGEVPRAEPINSEAYTLYLQARYLNTQGTAEALERSIELHKQALAIAPEYAPAWRALSAPYFNQTLIGTRPRDEGYALAREVTEKALAIDPDFAEAHASLGWIALYYDRDLAAAARHYEYALSLEPTNLSIIAPASNVLLHLGRLDEAIAIREYTIAHSPLNPISHYNLANFYFVAERPDEAIASVRTALLLSPGRSRSHRLLSKALLQKGENEAALNAAQQEPAEVWRLISLTMAYHALGQSAESDAALTELIEKYEQDWAFDIASALAYRGEVDRAFAWLDKAVQYNARWSSITTNPWFANIHHDPRWLPFLESVGRSPEQLAAIEFNVTLPE